MMGTKFKSVKIIVTTLITFPRYVIRGRGSLASSFGLASKL